MYERAHSKQNKPRPKSVKVVDVEAVRDRDVENTTWKLVEKVAAGDVRGVAWVVVSKGGYLSLNISRNHSSRWEMVGALEQLKADILGLKND